MKKVIVLFSGGLDSTTMLYYARAKGFRPHCLMFDYGQRHRVELRYAAAIAQQAQCPYQVVALRLPWGGSALLDKEIKLPHRTIIDPTEIPVTYVPARNIIFLSLAASMAEAIDARAIFIGANAIDYSGYPDCRSEFFQAYQKTLDRGLKSGVQEKTIKIHAPFLHKTKAQIIRLGLKLQVPYERTWSCYQGARYARRPCGACDSCVLRARGFAQAGVVDPLLK